MLCECPEFQEHVHAPAQDHAEGEDEKQAAGLLHGEQGIEVAARQIADGGERYDDTEKNAPERFIMITSPVRSSVDVSRSG